ncbi:MAG: L-threonylcarbamoyladenylate synthase [Deltaproteobacteria bacterium]
MDDLRTEYIKIDSGKPEPELIKRAAALISQGDLVAFPTETVYGLGASAFLPAAVEKIFIAKERPEGNPLLVHISGRQQLDGLIKDVPHDADLLMDAFWPGPLSIILPALSEVPRAVTGGQPGVGLRMPDHPVALALIEAAGPIAAPSANRSSRPSPLTAAHVRADLDGRIAVVLDGGPSGLGLESTVIDLSRLPYRLIRSGGVSVKDLEDILHQRIIFSENENTRLPHYQTNSLVILCENEEEYIDKLNYYRAQGRNTAVVNNRGIGIKTTGDVRHYDLVLDQGSSLYSILRDAEQEGIEVLLFAPLADTDGLDAVVVDRIRRSARRSEGQK